MTNVVNIALPDSEAMADRVVAEAARQLLTSWGTDPDGNEYTNESRLAQKIESAVVNVIREQAQALTPQIADKVIEQGVQQTDTYGYPRGEAKTLGAVIAEEITRQLKVNQGSGYPHRQRTLIEDLIHKEVEIALRTELKEAMDKAKQIVAEAVTTSATKALRDAVVRGLPEVKF